MVCAIYELKLTVAWDFKQKINYAEVYDEITNNYLKILIFPFFLQLKLLMLCPS